MSDNVECPYCEAENEINHDDGYGYAEDVTYQQDCQECGKTFVYTTSIHFYYSAKMADCLNGADHDWKPTSTYPREYTEMYCRACDGQRKMTPDEMAEFLKKLEAV